VRRRVVLTTVPLGVAGLGPDALTVRSGELMAPVPVWQLVEPADLTHATDRLYLEYKHVVTAVLAPHLEAAGITPPRLEWIAAEMVQQAETTSVGGGGGDGGGAKYPAPTLDVPAAIKAVVAELLGRERFEKGLTAVLLHRDQAIVRGACPPTEISGGGGVASSHSVDALREY
jgi:hypothetical protein